MNADGYQRVMLARWAVIRDARRRQRRRRRRRALLMAGLALAVTGALLLLPGVRHRPRSPSLNAARSLGSDHLGGQVLQAEDVKGRLWVLSCTSMCRTPPIGRDREALVEIGDRSGAVMHRFALPGRGADAFALTAGRFWIAHFTSGVVSGFNLSTGRAFTEVRLQLPKPVIARDRSFLPLELTYADGYLWASGARGRLAQIDPRTGRIAATAATPDDARSTIDRYGSWEAAQLSGIGLLGPYRMRLKVRPIMQDDLPLDVAMVLSSGRSVWALAYTSDLAGPLKTMILVIDPHTGRAVHRVVVPQADGVVATGGALYLGGLGHGRIYRVSPRGVLATLDVPRHNAWLEAASPGLLWGAGRGRGGGLIRIRLPGA